MCGSMVDIQSPTAEIRRGRKRRKKKKKKKMMKTQDENIMVCPITYGDHKNVKLLPSLMSGNYCALGHFSKPRCTHAQNNESCRPKLYFCRKHIDLSPTL